MNVFGLRHGFPQREMKIHNKEIKFNNIIPYYNIGNKEIHYRSFPAFDIEASSISSIYFAMT